MKLAGKTDIGNKRTENQDNYRAARLPDDTVWAAVCDGMGGAAAGKLASQIAIDRVEDCLSGALPQLAQGQERLLLIKTAMAANHTVYEESRTEPAKHGMGTTLVCVLIRDGTAHVVHVGDSRAYLYRGGNIQQITRDHSMVEQLVESGQLTREQAECHPQKNLITRALGVEPEVEPDYTPVKVCEGDILLLCSDGLSGSLTAEEMADIVGHTPFFSVPRKLIEKALKEDGHDNITALLIGVEPTEE